MAEDVGSTSRDVSDEQMLDLLFLTSHDGFTTPLSLTHIHSTPMSSVVWFLGPETWEITRRVESTAAATASMATMKRYITKLQSWFKDWICFGSNPFIHSRLYGANFPTCVQVAYATLATYTHRTLLNTDTVLQIVEDGSNNLLQENGAVRRKAGAEDWTDGEEQTCGLFAQLARLHALMVYQIIGLFDGDLRARHVAEGHIVMQDSWARKLLSSAAEAFSDANAATTHLVGCLPSPYTIHQ
jgi:hypothetical protein